MPITYNDMLNWLQTLNEDQLASNPSVLLDDEFYPVTAFEITTEDDVLDALHPVIVCGSTEGH